LELEYIDYLLTNKGSQLACNQLEEEFLSKSNTVHQLSKIYADYKCNSTNLDLDVLNSFSNSIHGLNFLKGVYYQSKDDWEQAVNYYEQEMENSPHFSLPYKNMMWALNEYDWERLDEFMLNNVFNDYIPDYIKNDYYFQHGHWFSYFTNLYANATFSNSWGVLIAAFIVSFIWIYYMRLMDFYNREKWGHVLFVFLLGGLFTNLCLPLYDFARIVLDFRINGEAFNDFMYCTLVIGGSEELVKFLPWFLFGYFSGKLREPFDYILYASVSALGFAFVENFIYLENYGNITIRAMVTSVAHMFDAVIIAYAFVIARYRLPKKSPYKAVVITLGFLLAILAHGFYDFWLISNSVADYSFITMIFFVISLHIWFFFKNNAMNHSPFFHGNEQFNVGLQKDTVYLSMIIALMLQYVLLSMDFGSSTLGHHFFDEIIFTIIFMIYFNLQLNKFKIAKNVWYKLSLSRLLPMKLLSIAFNTLSESGYRMMNGSSGGFQYSDYSHAPQKNLIGLELGLFAPKSNKYIGDKLPVTGYCSKSVTVNNDSHWYLFKLNRPVEYSSFLSDQIIIRHKNESDNLLKDKIEIYFMFIPDASLLQKNSIPIRDLRYAGRAYSRPLNEVSFK